MQLSSYSLATDGSAKTTRFQHSVAGQRYETWPVDHAREVSGTADASLWRIQQSEATN